MTNLNLKVLNLIKTINKEFFTEVELDGEKAPLIYHFRNEDEEAIRRVKNILEARLGKDEQYLFWFLYDMLNCPAGYELTYSLKPLYDLKIIGEKAEY